MVPNKKIPEKLRYTIFTIVWSAFWLILLYVITQIIIEVSMNSNWADQKYSLGQNTSSMYVDTLLCDLEASQQRNVCMSGLVGNLKKGSLVDSMKIQICDNIGNSISSKCYDNIDWKGMQVN